MSDDPNGRGGRLAPSVPVRGAGFSGRRYPGASDALVDDAVGWLHNGAPAEALTIKPGMVHRFGALALKRFRPHGGLESLLRRIPAVRAAEEYYRVWPVPSAAPLVAIGHAGRAGDSLLVTEFIEGQTLHEIWHSDAAARAALPALVASLYQHRIKFGDLHAQNLVWNDEALHLVDLDAMRNPAHRLGRLSLLWWVSLLRSLSDEDGVREAHDACFGLRGRAGEADANWRKVRALFNLRYGGRAA